MAAMGHGSGRRTERPEELGQLNPIFNISEADQEVAQELSPWTPSEARDLVIVPLLALSFVWTCGVLYLLLKRRASPLNTMWPSRALLVITAFCWQGCFAFTTGRAQMTDLGITAQEQCRLFIFADFGVFEPWFCLALMLSLNIQWPRCVVSLITRLSACTCRSSATDGTIAHTGHSSSRQAPGPDGLHSDETYPLPMEDSMSAGGMTARSAASEAAREASRGMGWRSGAGGEGGGREGEDRRHGFWEQRKTRIWGNGISKEGGGGGGYYYLTPSVSIIASIVMLFPSLVFNLAWYRVVVLGKEWSPMRLQVGGPCATWFGHLLGTAVYIAATIFFLHTNGRTLTSLAINVRLRRRLLWLRVSVSGLLIASFLLRFLTVFYDDLSAADSNAVFLAYFLVVLVLSTHSVFVLVVRPLLSLPKLLS